MSYGILEYDRALKLYKDLCKKRGKTPVLVKPEVKKTSVTATVSKFHSLYSFIASRNSRRGAYSCVTSIPSVRNGFTIGELIHVDAIASVVAETGLLTQMMSQLIAKMEKGSTKVEKAVVTKTSITASTSGKRKLDSQEIEADTGKHLWSVCVATDADTIFIAINIANNLCFLVSIA